MMNLSGIKKVDEFFCSDELTICDVPRGGRERKVVLESDRKYIVPGYQREIRWSTENVQILIDDLKQGAKFLGTLILSTSKPKEFEIIDGQQRITVITLMIDYLNKFVSQERKMENLCVIYNESFKYFNEALAFEFDYETIKSKNNVLFQAICANDMQNQRDDFRRIWRSIVERISPLSIENKEKLLMALLESELNVIVNEIEGTETQRKFCVDYFIDINNKSVELDGLDIIRAYAFKDNFVSTTKKWTQIQDKCNKLYGKVKYTRDDLFYQYFICNVNKEIEYKITKLSNDYKIKEDVEVNEKKYASGTFVWNMFKNDSFYSRLLSDLNEYLDFIDIVLKTETGGADEFKAFFKTENGMADETRILNAHTVINSILRNDDIVPKMMVMKYYFEILKPERTKNKKYRIISWIGVIANVFTMSTKRKGSELIASKVLQEDWQNALREYGKKIYKDVPTEINFGKINRDNGLITIESGQYMARRFFTMRDSCSGETIDEEVFKNENITSGDKNIEHFVINREYTYVIYLEDGSTIECEIKLPAKHKKNIATIANYLILNSEINRKLKNRTAYEKIDLLEKELASSRLDVVIPSAICQKHYYLMKKILHDKSTYPQKAITAADRKRDKEKILRNYYQKDFEEEFSLLIQGLSNEIMLFEAEKEYELKRLGFKDDGISFVYEDDSIFANVSADVDGKGKKIIVSAELYNPVFGEENGSDYYTRMIDKTSQLFEEKMGIEPELHSSNEYGNCIDESISFVLRLNAQIENVEKFLGVLHEISNEIEMLD